MSGNRTLIVNADDFGRSPGINAGIVEAHRDGIVTSTTVMVNTVWAEDALRLARSSTTLDVGLHLNFCYGEPVSDSGAIPTLVDDSGAFVTSTTLLERVARAGEILTEATAQVERFRLLAGHDPTHLDSHKYLHSTPRFLPVIAGIAAAQGLPVRSTGDAERVRLRRAGVATPEYFEGRFHGLDGDGVETELLVAAIRAVKPGRTELMCHPGFVDEHLVDSSYRCDRERELQALCSAEARRALTDSGITLGTFADLRKAS